METDPKVIFSEVLKDIPHVRWFQCENRWCRRMFMSLSAYESVCCEDCGYDFQEQKIRDFKREMRFSNRKNF